MFGFNLLYSYQNINGYGFRSLECDQQVRFVIGIRNDGRYYAKVVQVINHYNNDIRSTNYNFLEY